MALQPAYGFVPYGFRGLPQAPMGFGQGQSRFVVVRDRYGDQHAAELAPGERPDRAAKQLARDLGFDRYDVMSWKVVRASDAGAARLMGTGVGEADQLSLFEEQITTAAPKRRGISRKPGRIARCKIVKIKQRDGGYKRRKLCWDKHGVLASNTKPGARRGGRKVVCKRKCPKGTRQICKGGYRKVKGKRVCKKFICRRAA